MHSCTVAFVFLLCLTFLHCAFSNVSSNSHWLYLFYFSPQCVFKCVLKWPARDDLKLHWLHLIDFSPLCVFRWSLNCLPMKMQSHIDCMCLTFLHCVFSNVSSNRLPVRMQSHIGSMCLTFLRCVFSNVFSSGLHARMQSHIGCICLTFLHCVFLYDSFTLVAFVQMFQMSPQIAFLSLWLHFFCLSPLCVLKCLLKSPASEDAKSHWLQNA